MPKYNCFICVCDSQQWAVDLWIACWLQLASMIKELNLCNIDKFGYEFILFAIATSLLWICVYRWRSTTIASAHTHRAVNVHCAYVRDVMTYRMCSKTIRINFLFLVVDLFKWLLLLFRYGQSLRRHTNTHLTKICNTSSRGNASKRYWFRNDKKK